ncbi:hypothetical protein [Rhizobium sp. NFR03]|uniref:hypothetical protein n=1 Tax=Rhizobium sp. NFR03 TaxID=1566263 RepID=UPI0008CC2DB6|nr:hypothetical protein [Rhizobium sp. NFR03]SES47288.1 hypothetical protein SAMN03159406_04969 [Rhizobium sp. NFR03]
MVKELSEFQRMVALYGALDRLGAEFCPMPDEAMDAITTAQTKLEKWIVGMSAETHHDISAKFEFIAMLLGQDSGEFYIEFDAVQSALQDLIAYRNAQAQRIYGRRHAEYDTLLA